jgi:hypothetical protein
MMVFSPPTSIRVIISFKYTTSSQYSCSCGVVSAVQEEHRGYSSKNDIMSNDNHTAARRQEEGYAAADTTTSLLNTPFMFNGCALPANYKQRKELPMIVSSHGDQTSRLTLSYKLYKLGYWYRYSYRVYQERGYRQSSI